MVRFTVRRRAEDAMTLPERLLQILTLKCEGASSLTSRELDEPLGLPELIAVRGHLLVCRSCRRFRRQLLFLGGIRK